MLLARAMTIQAVTLVASASLSAQIARMSAATPSTAATWNVRYEIPPGWRSIQELGRMRVIEGPGGATIYLAPGPFATTDDGVKELGAFLNYVSMPAQPIGAPAHFRVSGMPAMSMFLQMHDRAGRDLRGLYMCVLSPHGTGVNFIAITPAERLEETRAAADRLVATLTIGAPAVNYQLMQAIAGTWTLYSGSSDRGGTGSISTGHDESVEFDGRGRFASSSSSYTSGSVSGTSVTGDSQQGDAGSYTVIGNTLLFRGRNGTLAVDFTYDPHHLSAGGRTFIR